MAHRDAKELEPMLATNSISADLVRQAQHKNATIDFDIDEFIRDNYDETRGQRSTAKALFTLLTCGLGACWLWCDSQVIREGEYGVRQTFSGDSVILPPCVLELNSY